ncbi:hypothetical protein IG631_10688 [Alternaria alternata]|nr:hypothetical protein IG631_10688 [Alternaria alternata]
MTFLASILPADSELFSFKGAIFWFAVFSALVSTCSTFLILLSLPVYPLQSPQCFHIDRSTGAQSKTLIVPNYGHRLTSNRPPSMLFIQLYTMFSSTLSSISPVHSSHARAVFPVLYICLMAARSNG